MEPALPPPSVPSTSPSPKPNNVSMKVFNSSDLLSEILLRLPAESIVKFQSVSKELFSLISSLITTTEFQQQHTFKPQKQSLIVRAGILPRQYFHLNPTSRRLTSLNLSIHKDDGIILQSSNGLLLLKPYHCLESEDYYVYVHNPATKQSRKIIIPNRPTTHPHVVDAALAFDPSKSPYYKLVCIRRSLRGWVTYLVEVYCSKSHTWDTELCLKPFTLLPTSTKESLYCFFTEREKVYWNNAIYWSSFTGPYHCFFDLAMGEMKSLAFPPKGNVFCHYENGHGYSHLKESNGHLFHVELMVKSEGGCGMVAVWELDDDNDWLLRHHHVLPPPPRRVAKWKHPRILTFLVDTCSLLICWNEWIRFFNIEFGTYEDLLDATGHPFFPKDYKWHLHLRALEFGGTLASV